MTTSEPGRKMIMGFEGEKLTAYQDQRGIWTVCAGHTGREVVEGYTCTPEQCDAYLAADLAVAEGAVNRLVTVPLTQNQFDACVSLCYNIGQGNFAHSTVVRDLNAGNTQGAADAILMWCKTNGTTNPGLLNRRTVERILFLTPNTGDSAS